MHAGKENAYVLKKKIPVYIGYFTAWVDDKGEINKCNFLVNTMKQKVPLFN